ncbi:MAG TPA: hypothetical protein VFL57_06185, partial [Bryobacteraceae bacterium]|nr:hypothetical protein [Bryobacteraceae bacterium]
HGCYTGCLTRVFFDYAGDFTRRVLKLFSYTRSVVLSAVLVVAGAALTMPMVRIYWQSGLRALPDHPAPLNHVAVTGLLLVIAGCMTFTFTLALHAAAAYVRRH